METFKKTYGVKQGGVVAGTETFTPKYPQRKSGAQKGLEAKMGYWADKDYQYEYGVTVGMCMNLGVQIHGDKVDSDKIKAIFRLALEMKIDPEMIAMFDEYYGKKKRLPQPGAVQIG